MNPIRMERIESAIRIVLEFNEAFNRHDVAGMARLMSDDCVFETADGARYSGKEAALQFLREAPRVRVEIEEIFGFGNRCIMRWRYGEGEEHTRGADIFQMRDGFIRERLSYIKG